jgi:two-component system chemotaxis response regulator CheY
MGRKIMVVDDSSMIRMQVKRALVTAGYDVDEAVDGRDAADKIGAGAKPSVIVCDVNMPRMNGIEFLEHMQKASPSTPIVMLTTEGQPDLLRKARMLGAKGWLVKPFKPELLLAAIDKLATVGA